MMSYDIPSDIEAALGDANPNLDGSTVRDENGATVTESEFA